MWREDRGEIFDQVIELLLLLWNDTSHRGREHLDRLIARARCVQATLDAEAG